MRTFLYAGALFLAFLGFEGSSLAADAAEIDKADTAWLMVSTAMVMFMIPGLAIFYAGMARKKNVLSTIMQSFFILCLITVQWVLLGYTLSFGPDTGGFIGGLDFTALSGVGIEPKGTIPHLLFMVFQGMFAAITVALITGAVAERIKFSAVVLFSILWAFLVYDPLAHWVWGGGWLQSLGVLDFAGGMVVHMSSGISALVAAIYVGRRKGWPRELMPPHNLTLTVIGMGILWFGWFGFNAGSALAADGVAVNAFVTTNTAAAVGTLVWAFIEWAHRGKPTMLGAMSGTVAGLGSITPAAGFVTPQAAILIGVVAAGLCYIAVTIMKIRLKYDDTLDVFGIHGVAGTWGTLATGLLASVGATGLIHGNPALLMSQVIGAGVTVLVSVVGTLVILKVVDLVVGLRVSNEEEIQGLDLTQHEESGYNF
ncbi:MAG TPA: ammonia channel protein [Deltaproteobacteria bacterium]|nr:ammonia channel protein [Deltaproteobacteria bacterium]HCY09849.1 ammonia channel protein [Deltaproteobacteria bacterium]